VADEFRERMAQFEIAPAAERDIEAILHWTYQEFGEPAMERYGALVTQAIRDVVHDPELVGSSNRPEIAPNARTYPLLHSRNHVAADVGRVKHPRHFLLYRVRPAGTVEIGRVLHDSMDLAQHLPDKYRTRGHDADD
jgi:toxin ParE1/3/4